MSETPIGDDEAPNAWLERGHERRSRGAEMGKVITASRWPTLAQEVRGGQLEVRMLT
jgi:hypothetical protein